MRKHISTPPQSSVEGPTRKMSGRRVLLRGAVGAAAVATLTVGLAGTAFAAPGDTSLGGTAANVGVTSAISLTGLTPAFTLTGLPGATVSGAGAVGFNVKTNNFAGYAVTVQTADTTLAATLPGNTDSIPIAALTVREAGSGAYTALSDTPVTVHTQDARSVSAGDAVSNDFQLLIPFVSADTYSATLNYVATTL